MIRQVKCVNEGPKNPLARLEFQPPYLGSIYTVVREGERLLFLQEVENGLTGLPKEWFENLDIPTEVPKYFEKKGKPRISLVPPRALLELAKAFTDGEKKYGMHDYQKAKLTAHEYLDAAGRHWNAICRGEDLAQDSRLYHAAHGAACFMIYLELELRKVLVDDRFKDQNEI